MAASSWDGCYTASRPAAARLLDGAKDQLRHRFRLRNHGRVRRRHLLDPRVPTLGQTTLPVMFATKTCPRLR